MIKLGHVHNSKTQGDGVAPGLNAEHVSCPVYTTYNTIPVSLPIQKSQ